jgi:hypothetical protein
MKRLLEVFVFGVVFSGCATTTFNLPVADPSDQVVAIKNNKRDRLRAGNVLFVNRSEVWREVLVFDGRFYEEQLLCIGPDGFPMISADPIGRFDIGPAEDQACDEDTDYNRKLVSFKYPGQEYTLFIVSKHIDGDIAGPIQIMHGRVSPRPMSERYYYRAWLGPYAGQVIYEIVNDVEFLPNMPVYEYRGTNYLLDTTININQLLRRGIHRAGGSRDR